MKLTNDKYFIDSNIIVYSHSDFDKKKQKKSQSIIAENITVVSTQVVQETSNILTRKFNNSWSEVIVVIDEVINNNILHIRANASNF